MGDTPKIRRTIKSRGAPADPDSRDPYPATFLPTVGAPGELRLFTERGIRERIADIAQRCRDAQETAETSRDIGTFIAAELRAVSLADSIVRAGADRKLLKQTVAAAERLEHLLGGQAGGVVRRSEAAPFVIPDPKQTH